MGEIDGHPERMSLPQIVPARDWELDLDKLQVGSQHLRRLLHASQTTQLCCSTLYMNHISSDLSLERSLSLLSGQPSCTKVSNRKC